jgi:hypothetical protein
MKSNARHYLLSLLLALPLTGLAGPTGGLVKVKSVRPYAAQTTGGTIYFVVDSTAFCSTDTFAIDLSWGGSKEIVATLMTAFVTGSSFTVEAHTACAGWGTSVQSITLYK